MAVVFGLRGECGESGADFSVYHYMLGKSAKKQAGEWQVEKLGHFSSQACDNILCVFVPEFRVQRS